MSEDPAAEEATPPCPACGAPRPATASFCGACGLPLARRRRAGASEYGRSRAAWRTFSPVLQLWAAFCAVQLALGWTYAATGSESPALDFAASGIVALVVLLFALRDRDEILPLLGTHGFDARTWWLPVAVLAAALALVRPYFWLIERLGGEFEAYLPPFREHGWPLWTAYAAVALLPALLEEIAFRGVVLGRLQRLLSAREALVIQAMLFSVIHLLPLIFVSHFLLGLGLGLLRQRSGSLWPGIVVHAAWNALALVEEQNAGG